jgi:hypothetical protein
MFTFTVKSLVVASKGVRLRTLATAAAANGKAFSIPVIDFSKFKQAQSAAEKQETAEEIVTAFKESGFVYLSNHGIPRGTVHVVAGLACLFIDSLYNRHRSERVPKGMPSLPLV